MYYWDTTSMLSLIDSNLEIKKYKVKNWKRVKAKSKKASSRINYLKNLHRIYWSIL